MCVTTFWTYRPLLSFNFLGSLGITMLQFLVPCQGDKLDGIPLITVYYRTEYYVFTAPGLRPVRAPPFQGFALFIGASHRFSHNVIFHQHRMKCHSFHSDRLMFTHLYVSIFEMLMGILLSICGHRHVIYWNLQIFNRPYHNMVDT